MVLLFQDRIHGMYHVELQHARLAHVDHSVKPTWHVALVWRVLGVASCRPYDDPALGRVDDSSVFGHIHRDVLDPLGVEAVEPDHGVRSEPAAAPVPTRYGFVEWFAAPVLY